MQLVSRNAEKEVESLVQLASDRKFDKGKLSRHVKRLDDWKRILVDNRDEYLAGDGLTKEIVIGGRISAVSGSVVYKKKSLMVSRQLMAVRSLQDVLLSPQDVPESVRHSFDMLHAEST